MVIRLQFINLVVPIATLERALAEQGGFQGFIRAQRSLLGEMVCHDAYLCRVEGAMDWTDVDDIVTRREAYGLQGSVGVAPQQWWKDLAIYASRRGTPLRCDWSKYDAADNCVYLSGTAKSEVQGPAPL